MLWDSTKKKKKNGHHQKVYRQQMQDRECGEKETLLHCWWERKLVQLLQRTVRKFLEKLKLELPSVQFSSVQSLSHVRLFATP